MNLNEIMNKYHGKSAGDCSNTELYAALLKETDALAASKTANNGIKKLYYISAEFLIGKLLSNNLINLGIYDNVKGQLAEIGRDIADIEEEENEPSLGNGGLGRLAACFLDSAATLGINCDGIGLNYHFGLFRQIFKDNVQTTVPDKWLSDNCWLNRTDRIFPVRFGKAVVAARLYEINVTGYNSRTNKLRLFDVEGVDENMVTSGIDFDKTAITRNLTLFLYPDDSDENGRLLRIYQQYFMVICNMALMSSTLMLPSPLASICNMSHPLTSLPRI